MEIPKNPGKGLKLLNSWGRKKVPFVPIDPHGQQVKVYVCGPTVYDSAHLGHARAYLTFDIILRVLQDYFGYDLFYVMNITDVDDKIILRARQNYLFDMYVKDSQAKGLKALLDDVNEAFPLLKSKHNKKMETLAKDQKDMVAANRKKDANELGEILEDEKLKLQNVVDAEKKYKDYVTSAKAANTPDSTIISTLLPMVKSELRVLLDKRKGSTVTDLSIFRAHAAKYEEEFLGDLKALGVRMPAVLTRVSEYIPEIIHFVEKLVEKGVAYESNGSVYFNVPEFSKTHAYCKLRPECAANSKLNEEGEGALGSTGDKKCNSDFALWKKSKAGEPQWESPWGMGRPGWHIECSAMSGQLLGGNFDIHGGGVDLQFPHHDNEIAQSEAFFDTHQWVNYWMHAGHLHVKGRKMSKSLKNFTTIGAALKTESASVLRLMFLLAKWDAEINFDKNSLQEVIQREKQIKSFFTDAKIELRKKPKASVLDQKWNPTDKKINNTLIQAKSDIHEALCDNLNWPVAMKRISDLISIGHKYLRNPSFKPLLLSDILAYTTRMLKIFGLIPNDGHGFGLEEKKGGVSREEVLTPYLDAFVAFRNELRSALKAAGKAPGVDKKVLFEMCDNLRDEVMASLGVRVTDAGAAEGKWSLDDPKVLINEVEARRVEEEKRRKEKFELQRKKAAAKIKKLEDEIQMFAEHKVPPADFFKLAHKDKDNFTQFTKDGMPSHMKNGDGEEIALNKSVIKSYGKVLKKYSKNYTKCMTKLEKDENYVQGLQKEITSLKGFETC